MKETFLPVKGYPNYEVSNFGRVRTVKRNTFLVPTKMPPTTGHSNPNKWRITLCKEGKRYNTNIHTLVGRAFLPGYKEGLLILHKNEDLSFPEINYADNLWVGTQSDNRKDCLVKGRNNQGRDKNGRFSK